MSGKRDSFYSTKSSEQRPAWEVNRSLACQENVHILGNWKVCYHVHNSPQSVPVLRQIFQAHIPQLMYLRLVLKFSSHLRVLFPSDLFHSVFPTKTCMNFSFSHSCYMSCSSHSPRFNTWIIFREENKSWAYPLHKFLQFHVNSFFFLGPNIVLSCILLDTLILYSTINKLDQVSHLCKTTEL